MYCRSAIRRVPSLIVHASIKCTRVLRGEKIILLVFYWYFIGTLPYYADYTHILAYSSIVSKLQFVN